MSNYTAKRRSGGGPTPLTMMVDARRIDDDVIDLEYSAAIDAAVFAPDDFQSIPSEEIGFTLTQISQRVQQLTLVSGQPADTQILYTGATPGILTPQTITI